MGPKTKELSDNLEYIASELEEFGETRWREIIVLSKKLIEDGDYFGIEKLQSCFGGMGSLSDLVFHDAESSANMSSETAAKNTRFHEALNKCYRLLDEISIDNRNA